MNKLFVFVIAFTLMISFTQIDVEAASKNAKTKTTQTVKTTPRSKKTGLVSKVKDAAARGFGYGLGREAAKATIKQTKKIVKAAADKTKEIVKEK